MPVRMHHLEPLQEKRPSCEDVFCQDRTQSGTSQSPRSGRRHAARCWYCLPRSTNLKFGLSAVWNCTQGWRASGEIWTELRCSFDSYSWINQIHSLTAILEQTNLLQNMPRCVEPKTIKLSIDQQPSLSSKFGCHSQFVKARTAPYAVAPKVEEEQGRKSDLRWL